MANKFEISTQVKEAMKEGLNLQEISWCETYLRTLSIKQACIESGLRVKQATEMLSKQVVKAYIMKRSQQHREAMEREKARELTRDNLSGVLEEMILNPLTKNDERLSAIRQLNAMREFDKKHKVEEDTDFEDKEVIEPVLSADEAEILVEAIRNKKK